MDHSILIILLAFAPVIIAVARGHKNLTAITAGNIVCLALAVLGGMVGVMIGVVLWFLALIASLAKNVETREKPSGKGNSDAVYQLTKLAEEYRDKGDYASALPLHRRALEIQEKALGKDNPNTKIIREGLALLYEKMGEKPKADAVRAGKQP